MSKKKAKDPDVVRRAYRTKLVRLGPVSVLFYRMMPDQFRHSPWWFVRVRLHLQWGPRIVEMAI